MVHNNNDAYTFPARVLGVCGTGLGLPGWLALSIVEWRSDFQLMKVNSGACRASKALMQKRLHDGLASPSFVSDVSTGTVHEILQ